MKTPNPGQVYKANWHNFPHVIVLLCKDGPTWTVAAFPDGEEVGLMGANVTKVFSDEDISDMEQLTSINA